MIRRKPPIFTSYLFPPVYTLDIIIRALFFVGTTVMHKRLYVLYARMLSERGGSAQLAHLGDWVLSPDDFWSDQWEVPLPEVDDE